MIQEIKKVPDLWDTLKNNNETVLLYGMGDGADKVLDVCESKGIRVSGVFASDGFAKNKMFRGFNVTDYATAKSIFGSFTVLMSFATSRDEVFENINHIKSENKLFVPDVPVFGDGLFDREYVSENYEKFEYVYSLLSDQVSKRNYVNLILGKITGNTDYLDKAVTSIDEAYSNIICPKSGSHYVDIGAYNGDTIREYMAHSGSCGRITAFEPDIKNFKKLCDYADNAMIDKSHFYNIAAWDKCEKLTFFSRSGRNSANTTSHKSAKSIELQGGRCDDYIDLKADYINIDAEGSDRKAILGLESTIHNHKPVLSCAIYHRNEDFFDIPILLKEMYGKCEMFIRHFKYYPAWDTNVYVRCS